MGVDYIVEATGLFTEDVKAQVISKQVQKVIISAPGR